MIKSNPAKELHDVIVLGSGISGALSATILAKQGYNVFILDSDVHPRFALGESTTPNTSQLFELLGKRYAIPEILVLAQGPQAIRKHITSACGVKRSFSFLYHKEGQCLDIANAHVFGNIWRDENHLLRQDVDAYLFHVALRYGAQALQGQRVESIDIRDDGVELITDCGTRLKSRYLIDACGYQSPLGKHLQLRHKRGDYLHCDSRSIYNHFINLPEFHDSVMPGSGPQWLEGTYHHVFHGGWFWVIPFNNWKGATYPVASVGLTLDNRVYPKPDDTSPEEEFRLFVQKFPDVAKHFANATPVRPWGAVPKCQYSSRQVVGDRWCLMAHSAGFIDPLFSTGLVMTVANIEKLIEPLCRALDTDTFSRLSFSGVEEDFQRRLAFTDKLVFGAYTSFREFDLWNAWLRIWAIGLVVLESNLGSHLLMGEYTKIPLNNDPIASAYEPAGYKDFFSEAFHVILKVHNGKLSALDGSKALWEIISNYQFEIRLRSEPEFAGAEWALKASQTRDLFLGTLENHARWQKEQPDPWLRPVSK